MTRFATLAASLVVLAAATADAGGCGGGRITYPKPIPTPAPAPTNAWYFGMSLQRIATQYGTGMQLASVTPGSPAALSGLERGDVLLTANGANFRHAGSNTHGVQILQQSVRFTSGGVQPPAPTATTVSTYVQPNVVSQPYTDVQVIDSRTGQVMVLRVTPIGQGFVSPQPTPAPTATATF